jgi:hypothetical protein
MNIDEIEAGWGEEVFIWVRPATGLTWSDVDTNGIGIKNNRTWQPARLNGFVEPNRRDQYGSMADSRRVWLLATQYAYDIKKFEFGDLMSVPASMNNTADLEVDSLPAPSM